MNSFKASIFLFIFISTFCAYSELPDNLFKTGWLESQGGYIRTGITQQGATQVIVDCVMDITRLSHSSKRLMGFFTNGLNNYFGISTGNSFYINKASTVKACTGKVYHIRMIQDENNTVLEIYDYKENFEDEILLDKVENTSNGMGSSECQIFTIKRDSGYVCYGMRIHSFKITIDNELKADFIPVFDTNEGKPGMYDNVREMLLFGTGSFVCEDQEIYYGSGNTKILCDDGTMYFPSYTDFNELNDFSFPTGTILSGTQEATLTVGSDILDMHTLFGLDMVAGTKYQIQAEYPFGFITNFFITKSANISSLFVNLDDKDLNYLHSSIYNTAPGSALKISPTGKLSNLLTVKKFGGRGNTSWSNSGNKRPYKINLNDKFALIDNSSKNKKFALLPVNMDNADHSGLREYIAHELGDSLEMNFTPDLEFIDLYVNGSYRGFYVAKERVTIDPSRININEPKYAFEDEESTTRIIQKNGIKGINGEEGDSDDHAPYLATWDIPDATEMIRSENDDDDPALKAGIQTYQFATNSQLKEGKEGGVVIEMNVAYGVFCKDEHIFFVTRRGQLFSMKTPEVATQEQVQRIAIFVQELEDALFNVHGINSKGKHYSEYLDVDAMAKRIFVDGFLVNFNFALNSTFFYIDADTKTGEFIGKLIAEPIWDYDDYSTFSSTHLYFNVGYEMHYIPQLFNKADFIKSLFELQNNDNGFRAMLTKLNTTDLTSLAQNLAVPYQLNYYRFGTNSSSDGNRIISRMATRSTSWNDIWNEQKLMGAWITTSNNRSADFTLVAEIYGTAQSYQWYKLDEITHEPLVLENETEGSLDPKLYGKGEYVCGVRGKNLETQAGGNTITLFTAPFNYTLPEPGILCLFLMLTLLFRKKHHYKGIF